MIESQAVKLKEITVSVGWVRRETEASTLMFWGRLSEESGRVRIKRWKKIISDPVYGKCRFQIWCSLQAALLPPGRKSLEILG